MDKFSQERWVGLYRAAILESEPSLVRSRVHEARTEIGNRSLQLREFPSEYNDKEERAMCDALCFLRKLEQHNFCAAA